MNVPTSRLADAWARHRHRRAWLTLLALAPAVALYATLFLPPTWTKIAGSRWPTAPARLLRATSDPSSSAIEGPKLDVDFAYFIDGRRYEATQAISAAYGRRLGITPSHYPAAATLANRDTVATFDPGRPGRAMLERRLSRPDLIACLPLLVAAAACGAFLYLRLRRQPTAPLALDVARNAGHWTGKRSIDFPEWKIELGGDQEDEEESVFVDDPPAGPECPPGAFFAPNRPRDAFQRWRDRLTQWPVQGVNLIWHPLRRGRTATLTLIGLSSRQARLRVLLCAGPFTTRGRPADASWSTVVFEGNVLSCGEVAADQVTTIFRLPLKGELPSDAIDFWLWIEPTVPKGRGRPLWLSVADAGPVTTPATSV